MTNIAYVLVRDEDDRPMMTVVICLLWGKPSRLPTHVHGHDGVCLQYKIDFRERPYMRNFSVRGGHKGERELFRNSQQLLR